MTEKQNKVDRGDLKQNLSEKFVWAIAYGSCMDGEHLFYQVIGLCNQDL